jgi:hypothetical protein
MRSRALVVSLVLAALALPAAALADTVTYTYTGNPFTNFATSGSAIQVFTPADILTIQFTVAAPLINNLPSAQFSPISFSLSDGVQTITDTTPDLATRTPNPFQIATDSTGTILHWYISLADATGSLSSYNFGLTGDDVSFGSGQSLAYATSSKLGTWSITDSASLPEPSPVPEPSTLSLGSTGLLGALAAVRRSRPRSRDCEGSEN